MIHGIGTDIVAVSRLTSMWERHGERIVDKLLLPLRARRIRRGAGQGVSWPGFAAKEAFAKGSGNGVRAPATLPAIGVAHDELGKPVFALTEALGPHWPKKAWVYLSISDEAEYAVAYVILERT